MNKQEQVISILKEQGLLPLYFNADKEVSGEILRALYKSGVRVIEYTNRGETALQNFSHLRTIRDKELPGLYLAAGTIKTRQHALAFLSEGADFLISPGLDEETGKTAAEHNTFWIPGCMTPSEIMKAEQLDATVIKLFPGNLLGPGFLCAIKELFPSLQFIPTGGVKMEQDNLSAWFKSGVMAVGAGSTLISKDDVANKNYAGISDACKAALSLMQKAR